MAGFTPNEGETFLGNYIYKRILTDRDADLELGLFTNSSVSETTTEADITEPTGTGYARITLTDASWTVTGDVASYAQQVWTAGGAWTGDVYGYFICTKASGGTQRLLHIEVEAGGPRTMAENDEYRVTPSNTTA